MPGLILHRTECTFTITDCEIVQNTIRTDLAYKSEFAARSRLYCIQAFTCEILQSITLHRVFVDLIDRHQDEVLICDAGFRQLLVCDIHKYDRKFLWCRTVGHYTKMPIQRV